ncbi:MAG: endopeptidase La [Verrucomicrobiales bacterium]|nr:endopeptidase La [Verrucomicrobiales bacterium]
MGGLDSEFIGSVQETGVGGGAGDGNAATPVELPEHLPVLGLSDIVIFPGNISPLLVDSGPSVRLVDDVVGGDRLLCLVLQKREDVADPAPEDLYEVGCAARVLKMLKYPDNTARILVEGLHRVRVGRFVAREPYLRAKVKVLAEKSDESEKTLELTRMLHGRFQEILKAGQPVSEHIKLAAMNVNDPGRFSDMVAGALNLKLSEKQRLLANPSVGDRLRKLAPMLDRELALNVLGSKIQDEVTSTLTKSQRDYFLREQLRVIRRELGEGDPAQAEWNTLRQDIERADLPDEVRVVAMRELDRLTTIPTAVAEHTVLRSYLDWLLQLPWNKLTTDRLDLSAAAALLDREHHGLQKVKDRLLEFLSVMKLKPDSRAPILCLVGPPGVGKTSLGRSLAEALGRNFARISLGGMRDEAEIRGHRRTYVAAMPGRILQALRRAGSRNPVMLLDELDKLGSDFRGDPASALLEVLDPEQNRSFTDHYLELPFDLSRVLFITTANWLEPVHPALRDRLEVIELPSYTLDEKLQILRKHLLPRQLEEHGLKVRDVRLRPPTLRRIVEDYTREAGVRQLNREIAGVLRKAARRLADGGRVKRPFEVKPEDLPSLLGPPRFADSGRTPITQPGIALGLAWTPVGGELLHIEASRMSGNGKLILTGSLGDVMKESAHAALSLLRSEPEPFGMAVGDHERFDLHIHVPAGATPKDGPSAGLALCVAMASLFSGRCVRSDTAVTGEISLRGRVLPVGGIKEKILAALRNGIRRVILPEANRKDLPELPEEILNQIQTLFVGSVAEALPQAIRSTATVPPRHDSTGH